MQHSFGLQKTNDKMSFFLQFAFGPSSKHFRLSTVYLLREYVTKEMAWVWLLWLVSQAWICMHAWQSTCERLASTDKLFCKPWYCGPLIDQSLLMNRTKDKEIDIVVGVSIIFNKLSSSTFDLVEKK